MANYIVTTDFAAKDALPSGNPGKVAQGTQLDTELDNIATAIATKEDTANKGSANGYAGLDSSADVPRAQLPSSVAYEDEANTFTGVQTVTVTPGATGQIQVRGVATGATNLSYISFADSAGTRIGYVGDSISGTSDIILNADTAGANVNLVPGSGGSVLANSNTIWHAGNDGAGSGLDADLLDGASSGFYQNADNLNAGTLADARVAQSNVTQHQAALTTRNITGKTGIAKTLSTSTPSGGSDGDIWYRY